MATSRDVGVNAEITYSLEHSTQESYFTIHPKTGIIQLLFLLNVSTGCIKRLAFI